VQQSQPHNAVPRENSHPESIALPPRRTDNWHHSLMPLDMQKLKGKLVDLQLQAAMMGNQLLEAQVLKQALCLHMLLAARGCAQLYQFVCT
jgi:hypothetical protein